MARTRYGCAHRGASGVRKNPAGHSWIKPGHDGRKSCVHDRWKSALTGKSPSFRVAVLGTGLIGAAVAHNLARKGFTVRAWNRSAEKAQSLAFWMPAA
ncbi:NAD(P)-binding domain-containing protein [Azospirillum sp. sgz302134]